MAICKVDADALGLGNEGAIAFYNSRVGLVCQPKPAKEAG